PVVRCAGTDGPRSLPDPPLDNRPPVAGALCLVSLLGNPPWGVSFMAVSPISRGRMRLRREHRDHGSSLAISRACPSYGAHCSSVHDHEGRFLRDRSAPVGWRCGCPVFEGWLSQV